MSVMERHLFVLLLLTGVLPLVLSQSRKYILIQQQKTWSDAQAYCRDKYIDLAIINTNDEMTELQNVAQRQQFNSKAWIGFYTNINGWIWTMNNESLGSFRPWHSGEPNGRYTEKCAIIYNYKWNDASCDWPTYFVCFDDKATGPERYVLIMQTKSWSDAQSYCRQHHTNLASVRDATENLVVGAKNPIVCVWIDLTRHHWNLTGQTTDVFNINCASLDVDWVDDGSEQCSSTLPFFCYKFPEQQQIIRMKLKSSEDVNDPAIISAIYEKLKQKLEEHGMTENITVTWRKQPDGEVFHKEEENITTGTNATEDCDSVYFVKP